MMASRYDSTDTESISVNANLGTENPDDYVALVYLTWNVKNTPDTTKDMFAMYSEDFAARIVQELPNVSEFCVFWTVPYYSESDVIAKYAYQRENGGMYETDEVTLLD